MASRTSHAASRSQRSPAREGQPVNQPACRGLPCRCHHCIIQYRYEKGKTCATPNNKQEGRRAFVPSSGSVVDGRRRRRKDLIVVRRLVTPIMNYGHALLLLQWLLPMASASTLRSSFPAQSLIRPSAPATSVRMCSSDESSSVRTRGIQMQQQRMTQMSSAAMRRTNFRRA